MTPSTSLTLQGFLQGLHANAMGLVVSIITIMVILFVVRWFINKVAKSNDMDDSEVASARSWANSIAGAVTCIALIVFAINAATYTTNVIPRTGLDRSSINQDMDANIQKR